MTNTTITVAENSIVERLKKGLGQIVSNVGSYGGELDDGTFENIRQLPAVWVTYGGTDRIDTANTSQSRYREQHAFIVMCVTRSLRSEASARQGGVHKFEIGSYQLIECVKRLLVNQTLKGLIFNGLKARKVRTLFNNQKVRDGALSCFAIEFEAIFNNVMFLEDGRFPEKTDDPNHPDFIFNDYERAELAEPYPDLKQIKSRIEDTTQSDDYDPAHVDMITKFDNEEE